MTDHRKNPHIGSDFTDWLKEEGIYEECTAHAMTINYRDIEKDFSPERLSKIHERAEELRAEHKRRNPRRVAKRVGARSLKGRGWWGEMRPWSYPGSDEFAGTMLVAGRIMKEDRAFIQKIATS